MFIQWVKNSKCLQTRLLAAFLGLATLAVYWPVTHHDFVDYDDNGYVTANSQVQSGLTAAGIKWAFTHPVGGNWHPITTLSHMLDCQWYGLQPWGHHLTSLCLHALNTVLLFLWLARVTHARWRSAWVAAMFAFHPLHVESVAWVAERKDVLSACFGWLTLIFYARYAQRPEAGGSGAGLGGRRSRFQIPPSIFYLLSLSSFALGLMSKPMLVTWPLVLLLLDYWPLKRFAICDLPVLRGITAEGGRFTICQKLVIEKIPFFALAVGASMVTYLVQQRVGAMETLAGLPLELRCENALISYCRYLFKMVWPTDLAVYYPRPAYWPPVWVMLAGLLLVGFTAVCWRKRVRYPFLIVGWFWFVGTLAPVIGLVQVGQQAMADRYLYVPAVGLLLLLAWGIPELLQRWRQPAVLAALAGWASVAACAALTGQQLGCWQNSETLFRHALKVTADNDVARICLGEALLNQKQTNAAISQFQLALQVNPGCAAAHENLGYIAAQQGRIPDAIRQYQDVLLLKPKAVATHNNLGSLLSAQGRTSNALAQFQAAIQLDPACAEAYANLGLIAAQQGKIEEAISAYQKAVTLKPTLAWAHHHLGNLFATQGRADAAISELQEVARLTPEAAQVRAQLARLLAQQGRMTEAIAQLQAAIHWQADFAEAYNDLGILFARQGQIDQAITQFQTALRLQPDYQKAGSNLVHALEIKSRQQHL